MEQTFLEYWEEYCEALMSLGWDRERSKDSAMKDFENGIPAMQAAEYFIKDNKQNQ